MSAVPAFAATPNASHALLSAANTNRDGTTGTYVTCFTAGSNGSRVDSIRINAAGTTTAGVIRLWLNNGTTRRLWREILVDAITPSTSLATWSRELFFNGAAVLVLPGGWTIDGSTHNAESFNVFSLGGNF